MNLNEKILKNYINQSLKKKDLFLSIIINSYVVKKNTTKRRYLNLNGKIH